MPIEYKVVLVSDMFGNVPCTECSGYCWTYGYSGDKFTHVNCTVCEGRGFFREETEHMPTHAEYTLQSPELARDQFGRHVHTECNGGGVRFFTQFGEHYWSCTSCKKWGVLSPPEWLTVQPTTKPLNSLANAKGAELLLKLRKTL